MGCAAAQRDLNRLGTQAAGVLGSSARELFFSPKAGEVALLDSLCCYKLHFLKSTLIKIVVGWSLTGFKMFLVIH